MRDILKILFLLTQDLDSPAGFGRYLPLATELVRLGYQVSIAALHPDYQALQQRRFLRQGVEVHYVAPMHIMKVGNTKKYYPTWHLLLKVVRATLALCKATIQARADVLQVGKPHPMNTVAGLVGKYVGGARLFVDCDDYEAGSARTSYAWQKQVVALFEKLAARQAEKVTTHTEYMRANLVSWGVDPEKIVLLPNGVAQAHPQPPPPVQVAKKRAQLGLQGKQVVAYIGTLSLPSHPVDLLLEAFTKVIEAIPEAHLLLVGGGEDYERLQQQAARLGIQQKVIFVGKIPWQEVSLYFALVDISVDPVHNDAAARGRLPLKIFESWQYGVPLVSGDVGERKILLGEPPAGILVAPGDPQTLADALIAGLSDPATLAILADRGRKRIKDFTWDKIVQTLDRVYQERKTKEFNV